MTEGSIHQQDSISKRICPFQNCFKIHEAKAVRTGMQKRSDSQLELRLPVYFLNNQTENQQGGKRPDTINKLGSN